MNLYGGYKRMDFNEYPILTDEIDGLRIITSKENMLYRKHPESLDIIRKEGSVESQLLNVRNLIKNKDPTLSDTIKNIKTIDANSLNTAVSNLIKASLDSTDWDEKIACIKAASYGKKISITVDPNIIHDLVKCIKILKILYNVSHDVFL